MLLLIFNLFIDYCGLKLSYGGTWNRFYRNLSRKMFCFRKKKQAQKQEVELAANDNKEPLIKTINNSI
jgi:hypothetical protein